MPITPIKVNIIMFKITLKQVLVIAIFFSKGYDSCKL